MNVLQFNRGKTAGNEILVRGNHFSLAANHPNVSRRSANRLLEHEFIGLVTACDNHDKCGRFEFDLRKYCFIFRRKDVRSAGKSGGIGKFLPVINNGR